MKDITYRSPAEIYDYIISNEKISPDDYVCIIAGRCGPTGKSWLTERLNTMGYAAIEITEPMLVSGAVSFNDDKNHFIVDDFRKSITIILNRILDNYELRNGHFARKEYKHGLQ